MVIEILAPVIWKWEILGMGFRMGGEDVRYCYSRQPGGVQCCIWLSVGTLYTFKQYKYTPGVCTSRSESDEFSFCRNERGVLMWVACGI